MANANVVELVKNLENAERELRNRRFIVEADAVKLTRQFMIPVILDILEKNKEAGVK